MTVTARDVALSQLEESKSNPRKLFGNVADLAKSIEAQGMLQPITARQIDGGEKLEIIIGHRRFRAAKILGLKAVPVIVREMSDEEAQAAMIVENAHREDVNPIELADAFAKMRQDFGLNGDQIADRVKLPRTSVYDLLSLHDNLFEPAKKAMLSDKLGTISGITLSRVRGERLQNAALTEALKLTRPGEKHPPVRAVKKLVQDKYLSTPKRGVTKRQREAREHGEEVALRRQAVKRLLVRVAELVERKHHLDEVDLRTMVVATAEVSRSIDATREVFARRGINTARMGKVGATQLRSLVVELALAPYVALDADGGYSAGTRVVAKAYGLSLAEIEKRAQATEAAEALFAAKT